MDKLKIKKNGEFIQIPLSAFNNDKNFITNATNSLLNYYLKNETYTKEEIDELIGQIKTTSFLVVEILPEIGESNIIYLVPKEIPNINNIYDEYIYVSNQWEKIGSTEIDLTDYVKNTDYATAAKGGTIKISTSYGTRITTGGFLYGDEKTYQQYSDALGTIFISKTTLENIIAGKGLVSNTDYATATDGGVVKANSAYLVQTSSSGNLFASDRTYSQYESASRNSFISKGTLENVIEGKGLINDTNYATNDKGGIFKTSSAYSTNVFNGVLVSTTKTYPQYESSNNATFISKGTLENVLNGKGLNDVWKKEEITEYPIIPDNSKIYVYRKSGVSSIYTWMYQNKTGQKFIKNPNDNLIDTPVSLNNEIWNVINQIGGYYLSANNTYMYQQFGSSSKPYTQLTLESENEFSNINSIDVYSAGGSHSDNYHIWCEVSIYDNENEEWASIGKQDVGLLTNNACNKLTFENNTGIENGKIKVEFTQNTTKAIYLGGIVLNTIMPVSPTFRIFADGNWYIVNTMENTITKEYVDSNFANNLGQKAVEDTEHQDLSYRDGSIHLKNIDGEQMTNDLTVRWASSAGNTIYSRKSQYDVDDEKIKETYANSMDLQDKTLTLYAKDHEETSEVYNEETGEYEEITEEVPTILSQVELPGGSELDHANINIPRIEARSLMSSTGNVIRLFIKDITPEFLEYSRKNGGIQIHLFRYVKAQYRHFYDPETGDGRTKTNEKKWIHPANDVCFGKEAVDKQCWGVASLLPNLLAHGYTDGDFYDYLDSADYTVANGGVVESEINISDSDLIKGFHDINLNDLMSCLVTNAGSSAPQEPQLDFLLFNGDGQEAKIIGSKKMLKCPVIKQPIKYRLAVPFINSKGYTDYLYGDSNTVILELAKTRLISGQELGYGANRENRILLDLGYGIRIKQ